MDRHPAGRELHSPPRVESVRCEDQDHGFPLDVNGVKYQLDARSNYDAKSAMEARADKANNPEATKAVPVTATITGRMRSNGKIRADIISVQQ